jgi:hypothetical protein
VNGFVKMLGWDFDLFHGATLRDGLRGAVCVARILALACVSSK